MGSIIYDEGNEIPLLGDSGEVSDGWHSFNDLYHYRMLYNAALFNEWYAQNKFEVHKSWRHSDGEKCFGKDNYFIVVAQLPTGQISNHYHGEYWDLFKIGVREVAAEYDGHSPDDVAQRLEEFLRNEKS